jgi:hypothetical protein
MGLGDDLGAIREIPRLRGRRGSQAWRLHEDKENTECEQKDSKTDQDG